MNKNKIILILSVALVSVTVISILSVNKLVSLVETLQDDIKTCQTVNVSSQAYFEPREHNEILVESSFKSYMPYTAITATNSKQYELQQLAYTETTYGLRMI